jgi:PAS domain S-box-containing protein
MRQEAWQSALLLTLVLLSVGLGAGFLWRERHALTLQRSLDGERERAALAERLAILTRYANDAILLFDEEGHILEANEQAIATYGYSETELRGLTASDLRSDQDRAAFLDRLREMGVSGGVRFESEHRRKDGSVFPAEVSGRAAPIGGRRLIMAIHRDITDRKSMEAALAQNLREVRARNDELSRFNRAMVDRELRMVELKQIINALQARLGETPRFATSPDPGGPAARTPRA